MNANDVLTAWKDYKENTGENISLNDFRAMVHVGADRRPARPIKERDLKNYIGENSDRSPFEALDGTDVL